VLAGWLVAGSVTAAESLDVVANRTVPDAVLKRSAAWAIFSMRLRTWSDGSPATVFVLSDNSPIHADFSKRILDTFPYQLRRAWDRLVFSGTGQAPTEVRSIAEMHDRILSAPGAVGYLPPAMVDNGMKTVRVE
jgi:hypothetical protein